MIAVVIDIVNTSLVLMKCPDFQVICHEYLTACSVKDLLDNVNDHNVIDLIREVTYSVRDIVTVTTNLSHL